MRDRIFFHANVLTEGFRRISKPSKAVNRQLSPSQVFRLQEILE